MWLPLLGVFLSLYALWVERRQGPAACDIGERISCTRAFRSPYGRILGVPNALIGLLFYGAVLFLGPHPLLTIPALFATVALAYISYVVQRNFCLVCTAAYLVNVALFIQSV